MRELLQAATGMQRAGADLLATALDAAATRLELVAVEFDEAQQKLAALIANAVLALLLFGIGLLLLAAWLVWVAQPEYRVAVLGTLAAGFLATAGVATAMLQRKLRGGATLLQATRAELRHDVATLRSEACA